ncbi:MAG: homocysteine S-methyltransferase family protein [Chloroflexota bacterium]
MGANVLERLKTGVLVRCGPIHTMLAQYGRDLAESQSLWSLEHPDVFQNVVKQYVDVGCDIISGNYGDVNRLRMKRLGLENKVFEYTVKLTKLTTAVVPSDRLVEAALGPIGGYLEPAGDITVDELYETWSEVLRALLEAGRVDIIRVSMSEIDQVAIGIKIVREQCNLPVVCPGSFTPTKKGIRTQTGLDPKAVAQKLTELGADIIGTQCGVISPKENTTVLQEMHQVSDKPLFVVPNAGKPELVDGKSVWPLTPEEMAEETPKWVAAGAKIIGGCCGVTPQHMARVRALIDKA